MRLVRRLAHALLLALMLVIGATSAIVIVSQTAWFKNWLRGYIVREAGQYLNGTLSIERLGGNLFFGIEMENIGVSMDGRQVASVKDLGLDYNLFELISRGLTVDDIRLNQPVIYLRREGDTWSISRLIKKEEREAGRRGPGRPISIDAIDITDGSVMVDGPVGTSGVELPKRIEHLDATLAFEYSPVRYTIGIAQLSFRGSDPEIALNALSGGVSVRDDTVFVEQLELRTAETSLAIDGAVQQYLTTPVVALQMSSEKLSLSELARLVPSLAGIYLQPAFELKLNGPLDRLGVDLNMRSAAGHVRGTVVADLKSPGQSVSGDLYVRNVNLAPILNDRAQESDITGDVSLDLQGAGLSNVDSLAGTVSVNAPRIAVAGYAADQVKADARIDGRRITLDGRASAYGAAVTTSGRIELPANATGATTVDLRGQARHLDLRRLPRHLNVPPAATDVNTAYALKGAVGALQGDVRFAPSTIAGAEIAAGGTASFAVNGPTVTYRADATVADLDLQRAGKEFRIAALATERYKTSINGRVVVSGSGTTPREMALTASGTLHDNSILGGQVPALSFDASVGRDTAHVKANGSFAGFDPAVVTGRPAAKGNVNGTLDVDATISNVSSGVTPDNVEATTTISLGASTVSGLDIASGTIDGDYRDSTADVRMFDIAGRDLNVQASGTLALNETDQSNLTVHADSPSLEQIGRIVNRPVSGIAKVDLTVTGNKRELRAAGTVDGSGVKYGDYGALAISSDFTGSAPQLDLQRARAKATTHGTFVTVAGQNINDLRATTDYADGRMTFDTTAAQPQRTLAAAGALVLHPDHQEVHFQQLSLTTQGMTWQTAPASEATIQYGKDLVTVSDFTLVNGDQRISADGTYGRAGDSLKVVVDNVDVGLLDALLLRPPQFAGRLHASALVRSELESGASRTPRVDADFTVGTGAFRNFKYESFGGTVNYSPRVVTLDTKLQQNPTTWIAAKGQVPTALVKGTGSTSTDPVDLHVDSTPIDAGLVQGLTTALTNVTGTLEAHVHVTGSAADPRPDGAITIQNAAFTLEPNGVVYTDLDGRIDLQPDRIHIDQIRVLDNHQSPLTVSGDLAIRERRVGEMTIAFKASDFKVIDNEMGNIRVDTDLRLTGQLNAPRLEGDLGVTTGQVNLDPILAVFGNSAYSTQQIEFTAAADAATAAASAEIPGVAGVMEMLQVDVRLTVPNDLVVQGTDLGSRNAPIGLGALNVTLGGDLYVHQVPYDRIRLYGTVNTVRGTYNFQGRQFTILRDGTVRFDGLDDFDPEVDISAERVIQAVTAHVNVRGTLRQPEIVLTSTPLLEEADILSLILFNQPINLLGAGQQLSLAQRAQSLATGALAGGLATSIAKALNVDIFEINTTPDSGAPAELTIGQQLGSNLYLRLQQGIGDHSQTNFILEYELARWLRLQTNVVQGASTQPHLFERVQGTGINLLFFFSY